MFREGALGGPLALHAGWHKHTKNNAYNLFLLILVRMKEGKTAEGKGGRKGGRGRGQEEEEEEERSRSRRRRRRRRRRIGRSEGGWEARGRRSRLRDLLSGRMG